ncbi:MAG: 3-dehydroquinate synthase [Planctomycetota bacterium]
MRELKVKIPAVPEGQYTIVIGTDILGQVPARLEKQFGGKRRFVVTDENVVAAGHLAKLAGSCAVESFVITPASEKSKNIGTVVKIVEAMEKASFGRDSFIIALGGGVVGDVAGFAGAIFKRGVPVVQIPTTTVSQADSAVGGKTGVDSTLSKNAFGAFWQPAAVYIDVATLKSLDDRQYRAGLVESVKHALIADKDYFEFLENNLEKILSRDTSVLEAAAYRNCSIKASVVEKDPHEQNLRRILNYGHTVGHAVEAVSGFELLHGEAVGVGIVAAAMIEKESGLADAGRIERVREMLRRLGLPCRLEKDLSKSELTAALKRDKKAVGSRPRFVLLKEIGQVYCENGSWAVDVAVELVDKVLGQLYN